MIRNKTGLFTISADSKKIRKISKQRKLLQPGLGDIDAGERIVLPGFIDCHSHLFSLAEEQDEVDLRGCRSIQEMQDRISTFLEQEDKERSEWLFGRGWDQDLFTDRRLPTKEDIDEVAPDAPCVMVRICGHIAVANSKALERLEFLKQRSEDLVPRVNGVLTGIVKETALDELWRSVPSLKVNDLAPRLEKVLDAALGFGLIGVHCILSSNWKEEIKAIRLLSKKGKLKIALSLFLPIEALSEVKKMSRIRKRALSGTNFQVLGFKAFADGSLGAKTAALIEPYSDDSGNCGVLYHSQADLVKIASRVQQLGFILATHAIGDRAIEQVLDAYKEAEIRKKDGFRIEHCSVVNKRFRRKLAGVVVSVQPSFATSDYWIKDRLGSSSERVPYPLRTLSELTLVVGGSDAPVETLNPIKGIFSAMNNPIESERLSLKKAVEIYTANAAKLSPLSKNTGKIRVGAEPSFVILDAKSPEEIGNAKVEQVLIRAKVAR
ncbi:MAG: amidohydrolase [Thaumarchaeota archaeon]|nr:amidohydrolase [Nitrososphaerota archaeon]